MKNTESGNAIWGIVVVFLGVVLLLSNTGVVSTGIWEYVVKFWPLILILEGLHIILGNNWISRIILTLVTLYLAVAIMAGGLKFTGSNLYYDWGLDKISPLTWVNYIYYFKQ